MLPNINIDCHSNKEYSNSITCIVVAVFSIKLCLLIDKDVYHTDHKIDQFKSSSSHSLIQLEDILTTYVMYNVDLGKQIVYHT